MHWPLVAVFAALLVAASDGSLRCAGACPSLSSVVLSTAAVRQSTRSGAPSLLCARGEAWVPQTAACPASAPAAVLADLAAGHADVGIIDVPISQVPDWSNGAVPVVAVPVLALSAVLAVGGNVSRSITVPTSALARLLLGGPVTWSDVDIAQANDALVLANGMPPAGPDHGSGTYFFKNPQVSVPCLGASYLFSVASPHVTHNRAPLE